MIAREPLECRQLFLSHLLLSPPARSPFPRHSHLQRTVGSIDKAKVLGFCQDHEGTLLMALKERNRERRLLKWKHDHRGVEMCGNGTKSYPTI